MLKSPEQYLSGLAFNAIAPEKDRLSAGERAFVEKYLGIDALGSLPPVDPEAVPLPTLLPEEPKRKLALLAEPQIIVVADRPELKTADLESEQVQTARPKPAAPVLIEIAEAEAPKAKTAEVEESEQAPAPAGAMTREAAAEKTDLFTKIETVTETTVEQSPAEVAAYVLEEENLAVVEQPAEKIDTEAPVQTSVPSQAVVVKSEQAKEETSTAQAALAVAKAQLTPEQALKEKWRKDAEIQMVSFLVGGQVFLLPVEGIQEVVRHMELIKVPQAPYFVAGAINLRGNVTPIVHLAALLTNAEIKEYSERNFIIITGTEKLKIGLIIDKVSSMHMIPQNKIIWNPESKLAEAAEFLNAIVDLDDHVCGMVAPENITRLILPDLI